MTDLQPELRTFEGRLTSSSARILSRISPYGQRAIAESLRQNPELRIDVVLALVLLDADTSDRAGSVSALLCREVKKQRRKSNADRQ